MVHLPGSLTGFQVQMHCKQGWPQRHSRQKKDHALTSEVGVRTETEDRGSGRRLLWTGSGFWEVLATMLTLMLMLAAAGESRPARLETVATDPGASATNSPESMENTERAPLSAHAISVSVNTTPGKSLEIIECVLTVAWASPV